jgi:hypothetical protein
MGPPPKVNVNGTTVFICCEGCRERLLAEPDKYLAKLVAMRAEKSTSERSDTAAHVDLPPIGAAQIIESDERGSEAAADDETSADAALSIPRVSELPQEGPR